MNDASAHVAPCIGIAAIHDQDIGGDAEISQLSKQSNRL